MRLIRIDVGQGQCRVAFSVIKRKLRRRSVIEAVIGHLNTDGQLGCVFLKGRDRDHANAVLTDVGYNLRLVLRWLRIPLRGILAAIRAAVEPASALNRAS